MLPRRVLGAYSRSICSLLRKYSTAEVKPSTPAKDGRKRASDASKPAKVKAVRVPKGNKADDAWKMSIVDTLHAELQESKKDARDVIHLRQSSAQLIRLAVDDDVLAMIPLMDAYFRKVGKIEKPTPLFDEFLSVCTLLVHRNLAPFVDGRKKPNDRLATSICFSFNNLIHKLKVDGPDTRLSLLLLYSLFERWSKLRVEDEHTREIHIFIERFEAKLRRITSTLNVTGSRLVLNQADREELLRVTSRLKIPVKGSTSVYSGYDENNDLVRPLEGPCRDKDYLENPFNIQGKDVKYYLEQLDKQLTQEDASWIRIDNFWKDRSPNVKESAEGLIEKWKWRERIAAEVDKQLGTLPLYPVKVFSEVLDRKELVDLILEAVTASCSLGQLLVPKPIFTSNLVAPIMKNAHSKFFNKLGINLDEIWRQIMAEYLQYFENDEIARTHTHRQWWNKICHRNGIPVDYQAPFLYTYGEMRQQFENFLNSVVLDACCFPHRNDSGQVDWLKAFSLRNVGIEEESRVTEEGRYNSTPMVHLNEKMMKQFDQHQFNYILFPTGELPMTVPPRPWVDKGFGGPDFKRSKHVLRNQSEYSMVDNNREMVKRLQDESQARPVFDALNQLGSTPWIINEQMLEVLCQVFSLSSDSSQKKTLNTLSVPLKSSSVKIPCVEVFKSGFESVEAISKEDWRKFYREKQEAEKNKNEMNSLWYWMMYRVVLAKHFRGQMLFFPHNMDFRGRVYPISPYLNHMGDDVNRCILKFAKGKPLGPNGLSWLKLHCINLTGKLKRKSIAERLQEAEERLPEILDSANNPLEGEGWWMKSEEPWQTLAACMELRDVLASERTSADFISHLPIHQDGSCNGLQHYAALGRDKQGGSEVNLLPEDLPSDVYSSVAVRVEHKRVEDEKAGGEDQEIAQKLRLALPQAVPRKVIKQTVMTTVYGVTMYGAVQQIKRQLKTLDIDNEDTGKFASYLARKTFASLHDAFTSSMQLKDWFRTCAKGTNELMRTVEWVTPLGLPVVQPYLRDKMTKNRLILQPIPMKQIDAFPPNYVHSLDSTHMMLTSLECARRGVTFAAVHDCFWTHASSADTMNEICREQFVNLHNQPLVEQLSDWFLDRYLPASVMTTLPQEEKDKFMQIFTPSVQPGDLDINEVKKSVYFFS